MTGRKRSRRIFELSVRSADAETTRNDVKESVAYDDEYGFSGSLTLQDITIGETLQADSTYMATAHYAGKVTRTEAGTVHYTLLYAPVSAPMWFCPQKTASPLPADYGYLLRTAFHRGAANYHSSSAQTTCPHGRTCKTLPCAESLCAVRRYCPRRQK